MSIYFVQVITALLGFTLFAALNNKEKSLKYIFLPSAFGVFFGIIIFKIARNVLLDASTKLVIDCITMIFLCIAFLWIFFEFKPAKIFTFLVLGVGYGFNYSAISALFPLFNGELLDTQSIISFFLMLFGFLVVFISFFVISNLKKSLSIISLRLFSLVVLTALIVEKLSNAMLELMRAGQIPTYPQVLSIVAKGIYISTFIVYFFIFIILILAFLHFSSRPANVSKSEIGVIKFRFVKAVREKAEMNAKTIVSLSIIALIFCLYYDFYASRPPQISKPILVEPKDNKFTFDVDILKDNKLHRYAYITDEGKEVRFFLLNRFSDRASPTIVFDACAICGDMGYVKKGDDLICISCNVRIFLPSVGKEGGCNPIPMPFSFDGKNIVVDYETILSGSNYFSKVVERQMIDPVSRKKVSNIGSRSYLYYNRTYFFENNETQAKFEANPEKYVDINGTLK
ncbi:DUF2318 domain-containing protein [Campylobacter sp. faydin G-24]|uniref:DUF2318 domain-containing protein n=1 Tax=Campylobacter anatolicus TaxID=2829105 RepID=A0ABS5HIC6_9BACT|nr:Fe-S-containing protein [Campylobacter anatolicus]MBR8463347.1 DUF2318 domain-containing protein [Campylobacter anatolicus]